MEFGFNYVISSCVILLYLSSFFLLSDCKEIKKERFIILFKGQFGISISSFLDRVITLSALNNLNDQSPKKSPALYPVLNFSFSDFGGLVYDVPLTEDVITFTKKIDSVISQSDKKVIVDSTSIPLKMPEVTLPSALSFLKPISEYILWIERSQKVTTYAVQSNPPWNLARISERIRSFPGPYRYIVNGLGVDAYIVDSGIQSNNVDFAGHASTLVDFTGYGLADDYGHGTHVSGIVGSKTYGVAKNVNVLGVRVIGPTGTSDWATVIAGLSWVYNRVKMTKKPSLVNLSIGGPISVAFDAAAKGLDSINVAVISAAGNNADDACKYSPSSSATVIAVAASDYNDLWFSPSNHGKCVDIIAPGSFITSTFIGGTSSVTVMSGTSMAAPHVTGVLALFLSMNLNLSVAQLKFILTVTSTRNAISNVPADGTPNNFLYSLVNN